MFCDVESAGWPQLVWLSCSEASKHTRLEKPSPDMNSRPGLFTDVRAATLQLPWLPPGGKRFHSRNSLSLWKANICPYPHRIPFVFPWQSGSFGNLELLVMIDLREPRSTASGRKDIRPPASSPKIPGVYWPGRLCEWEVSTTGTPAVQATVTASQASPLLGGLDFAHESAIWQIVPAAHGIGLKR